MFSKDFLDAITLNYVDMLFKFDGDVSEKYFAKQGRMKKFWGHNPKHWFRKRN